MTIEMLKQQRQIAGITAELVAKRAKIDRSRFSSLERGLVQPKPQELQRIQQAVLDLTLARQRIREFVVQNGLPLEALA